LIETLVDNEFPSTVAQLPSDWLGLQIEAILLTSTHLDPLRGSTPSDYGLSFQAIVAFHDGCEPGTHGVLAES